MSKAGRIGPSFRLLIITLFGGIIGVIAESLFGSKLFSLLMKSFGLSNIVIEFNLLYAVAAAAAIASIAIVSAMFSSRNVRKVSAYALIREQHSFGRSMQRKKRRYV